MLESDAHASQLSMAFSFASPYARRAALLCLVAIAAVCVIPAPSSRAQTSPQQAPPAIALLPSQTTEIQVAPGEHKLLRLAVAPETIVAVTFTQTEDMLSIVWTSGDGAAHVPRTNDAGLHSTIRFEIVTPATPATPSENAFDVACLHTHAACAATLEVSAARTATQADADRAAQEENLSQADDARRHGNDAAWAAALEKYKAAAKKDAGASSGSASEGTKKESKGAASSGSNSPTPAAPTPPKKV